MCFSSTASIGAFSFGVFWLTLIIIKKMYIYAALYASIIIMQLFEYFGHLNLSGKSLFGLSISNEVIAYLIFGTIIVQPIIWNLVYMFKRNNKKYMKVASFLLPLFVWGQLYHSQGADDLAARYIGLGYFPASWQASVFADDAYASAEEQQQNQEKTKID